MEGAGEGGDKTGWVYVYGCARVQLWAGLAKGTVRMDRSAGVHPCIHVWHEHEGKEGEVMGGIESVGVHACACTCIHGYNTAATPCSPTLLPASSPYSPTSSPASLTFCCLPSLCTDLSACLFTLAAPFVAHHLS